MACVAGFWRKYKRAFREVEFACDLLHLVHRQTLCVREYRQRISAKACLGKYITGVETVFHKNYPSIA
jgi:hypothetical protein